MRIPIAIALVVFALASPASAQERPRSGGELIFLVPSEPPSYDGHREGTFGIVHPLAPHYNTLLRIDPTDRTGTRVVPDLAESWTISPDGLAMPGPATLSVQVSPVCTPAATIALTVSKHEVESVAVTTDGTTVAKSDPCSRVAVTLFVSDGEESTVTYTANTSGGIATSRLTGAGR